MERPQSTCPECCTKVPAISFLRHLNRCIKDKKAQAQSKEKEALPAKQEQEGRQREKEAEVQTEKSKRKGKSHDKRKKKKQRKKKDIKKIALEVPRTVKCPKCTADFSANELEAHKSNCEYRICHMCNMYFPDFLLGEHIRYSSIQL